MLKYSYLWKHIHVKLIKYRYYYRALGIWFCSYQIHRFNTQPELLLAWFVCSRSWILQQKMKPNGIVFLRSSQVRIKYVVFFIHIFCQIIWIKFRRPSKLNYEVFITALNFSQYGHFFNRHILIRTVCPRGRSPKCSRKNEQQTQYNLINNKQINARKRLLNETMLYWKAFTEINEVLHLDKSKLWLIIDLIRLGICQQQNDVYQT